MNIQSTNVKAFVLTLTESEMRAAIADPFSIVSHFKAALNGAFDDGAQPVTSPSGKDALGRRKGKALRNYPKAQAKKITAAKSSMQSRCEICKRTIATKFMARHMSAKHGQATAAVA